MLTRALTPEQGEELQKIINKRFCGTLHDEQIPAALDFILEVLEYIITKGEEENDYTEWSDIGTEVKKIYNKAFISYRKLAKLEHTYEMDDPYDASWYSEKLLKEVLNVCNALSREIVQKKEETTRMNIMLEVKYEQKESAETDIVSEMELGNQKKDKNMTLEQDVLPTVTK
ncbi:5638_t:CDS:2, partial [Gigaspora margarita]